MDSDDEWNLDDDEEVVMPRELPKADEKPDTSTFNSCDLKVELMKQSGCYGPAVSSAGGRTPISQLIRQRELGGVSPGSSSASAVLRRQTLFGPADRCAISCYYLPKHVNFQLSFPNKVFCGTYSQDGNIFLSACQDRRIRVYDTSRDVFTEMTCIQAQDVGWSILDLALSPDGNFVVYTSWSDYLHLCSIRDGAKIHEPLCLAPNTNHNFCIFSVVFSQDNNELLGGANDGCLYVYDRQRNERTLRVDAHEDDVNAVAFADETSNILYSGSDDGMCKIWDRRSLREVNPRPCAVMAGHLDGITFIDSKGDARYFVSNSKDQTVKLWDMRLPSSPQVQQAARTAVSRQNWDYRWQQVPKRVTRARTKLAGDTSLMTYRGHCVLNTLVRSRFSPLFNTGQRYIYVGCATGAIVDIVIEATDVGCVTDVVIGYLLNSLIYGYTRQRYICVGCAVVVYDILSGKIEHKLEAHRACVRDVSWHPYVNNLVSSSWDCSVIEWSNIHPSLSLKSPVDCNSRKRRKFQMYSRYS